MRIRRTGPPDDQDLGRVTNFLMAIQLDGLHGAKGILVPDDVHWATYEKSAGSLAWTAIAVGSWNTSTVQLAGVGNHMSIAPAMRIAQCTVHLGREAPVPPHLRNAEFEQARHQPEDPSNGDGVREPVADHH